MTNGQQRKWLHRIVNGVGLFFVTLFLCMLTYLITVGVLPTNDFLMGYPLLILSWTLILSLMGFFVMAYIYSGISVIAFIFLCLQNDSLHHVCRPISMNTYIIVFAICIAVGGFIEYHHRNSLTE